MLLPQTFGTDRSLITNEADRQGSRKTWLKSLSIGLLFELSFVLI
jgi:hypothetical protein